MDLKRRAVNFLCNIKLIKSGSGELTTVRKKVRGSWFSLFVLKPGVFFDFANNQTLS